MKASDLDGPVPKPPRALASAAMASLAPDAALGDQLYRSRLKAEAVIAAPRRSLPSRAEAHWT